VAFDRDDALKKAEKFLRLGRLDGAIAEYQRIVDEVPNDWKTLNALGDLYLRANQPARAAALFARIADHLAAEGFDARAQAFYKRILKVTPDDERALDALAGLALRQGILVEAKSHLVALSRVRQARGDVRGAAEALHRVNTVDPTDFSARREAARSAAETGNRDLAAKELSAIAADLAVDGKHGEAVDVLREAIALAPDDGTLLERLTASAIQAARLRRDAGDHAGVLDQLSAIGEVDDPHVQVMAFGSALRSGRGDDAVLRLAALLDKERISDHEVEESIRAVAPSDPDTAWRALELFADRLSHRDNLREAVRQLREFSDAHPGHVAALMKLVEALVDEGTEAELIEAQARLAEAYIQAGSGAEARIIAEDLVSRSPSDASRRDLLKRALVLVGEPEPENAVTEFAGQAAAISASPDSAFLDEPEPLPEDPAPVSDGRDARPPAAMSRAAADSSENSETRRFFQLSPGAIDLSRILDEGGDDTAGRTGGNDTPEIDLTELLRELKPPPAVAGTKKGSRMPDQPERSNLDEVFRDFRDEVSRQTAADEAEQHYKVAMTYREMGMLDDAVRELELAARAPRLRFEAASTLARLVRDRGDVPSAIDWFERAAEAPAPTPEAGRALLYELGQALEDCGEVARALAVYLELQADAGDYADLKPRIERLSRVQTES
jgi:tetratricopeptide (TPR) repeat protein